MTLYSDLATTAKELLAEFGQVITISRKTGASQNPVTGITTAGTATDYLPKGILKQYKSHLIDGTRILATDRELVIDDTVEPLMTDTITIGGESWTPVMLGESNPAGTPLVYKIQVRR
jgi:hypothetical protein